MMTQRDYEVWFYFDTVKFMGFSIFLTSLLAFFTGCTPAPPRGEGSVLIVVISNFRGDDLSCGLSGDSLTPQLDVICKESVRFTHAYTPSVLSIPALASIFTGLYPAEHGVHRNGASHYLPDVKSLPEAVRAAGLETFLVSGGVPFLRKTAISKGFTDFDDTIRTGGSFYRKATDTIKKLTSLIENRSEETAFLGVVQLVDLAFPEDVLFNTNREEGSRGKLQEIDEAIGLLRSEFSRLKIWDPLTVVIVGLQGSEGSEHSGLSKGLSLYDEVVKVPLLIKPSRKTRDHAPSWKVDSPVTLVDLGQTLFKLMKIDKSNHGQLPSSDFLPALSGRDLASEDRMIFSESDLPAWRDWGPRLVSVRLGEWLYWLPPDPKLYNTYTDHLELRNLISIDPNSTLRMEKVSKEYLHLLKTSVLNGADFRFLPYSIGDKLRVAKNIFSKTTSNEEKMRSLAELEIRRPQDWQVVQWHASLLTELQDWPGLKELLTQHQGASNQDTKTWQTFLKLRAHGKVSEADCLSMALYLKKLNLVELEALQNTQSCKDQETLAWVNAFVQFRQKHMKEATAFFDLAKGLTDKRVEQTEFAQVFWSEGVTWDYNINLPEGPSIFSFFLALVGNSEFLDFTKKRQLP